MNPVVHFEMPGKDMERMKAFYTEAFGWKMNQLGPEMGNYVVTHTAETDEKGMVQTKGTINGGFYKAGDDPMSQHPSIVIAVPDIYAAMENVRTAGGTFLPGPDGKTEPAEIPGVGLFISMLDTEGNRVSIMQPNEM